MKADRLTMPKPQCIAVLSGKAYQENRHARSNGIDTKLQTKMTGKRSQHIRKKIGNRISGGVQGAPDLQATAGEPSGTQQPYPFEHLPICMKLYFQNIPCCRICQAFLLGRH